MTDTNTANQITVLVTEGRWDVVDEPTPYKIYLTQILTEMGGINESVPQGTYHFSIENVGGLTIAHLNPAE